MTRALCFSCDAKFYPHARELIASIRATSSHLEIQLVFFDLGLQSDQRAALFAEGITIRDYPASLRDYYPDFLTPRMFAWKTYLLAEAASLADTILYMDCGCVALNSIEPLFAAIERDGILLIKDDHTNDQRTHDTCFNIMQATPSERTATQIDAGMIGYAPRGPYAQLFADAFRFAQQRDCIFGDAVTHRHDQSIYSILAARYQVSVMHPYGAMLHWRGIESRDQIIWQHRGKWGAIKRLRDLSRVTPPARIAIYGTGQHTARFLATFKNVLTPRHTLVGFLDDIRTAPYEGFPVTTPQQAAQLSPDIILISSDAHEHTMHEKIRALLPNLPIWTLYA